MGLLHPQHEPLNVYVALVRQFTHAASVSATMASGHPWCVNRIGIKPF